MTRSRWKREGLGATLIALLVIAAVVAIIAIALVLHRAGRKNVPTQPRPSGSIIEIPAHPAHAGRPQRA